jgi:sterol desaturase/sphingolipid hydroxylase (fatty acid hydroxylase superfamily)
MTVLIVAGVALLCLCVERLAPGRTWPRVPGWLARVTALSAVQIAIVFAAGTLWDGWMLAQRPWSAAPLGTLGGAIVGYVAITFVYYFWHRARHASPFLWRWLHQIHHSPQRLEVVASFYKHPLKIAVNGILSSAVLYLVVGLDASTAAWVVAATGVAELFYHWNVSTPYWLGFFFQRPESHCVHHETGRHASNYSDLPIWDMLFGTFHNPREFAGRCGFAEDAECRLAEMLAGREVSSGPGVEAIV